MVEKNKSYIFIQSEVFELMTDSFVVRPVTNSIDANQHEAPILPMIANR